MSIAVEQVNTLTVNKWRRGERRWLKVMIIEYGMVVTLRHCVKLCMQKSRSNRILKAATTERQEGRMEDMDVKSASFPYRI